MASRIDARFRQLLSAARVSLLADARKHEAAKRDEERRMAAEVAQAEADRATRRAVRDGALDTLLDLLRDLRAQSRHIRVDGNEGRASRKLVLSVSYRNPRSQDIEVVQQAEFLVSDSAADNHVGIRLKPRKVFKTAAKLREYVAEEFLREVARSVAVAEAAKRSGQSVGIRQGRLSDHMAATKPPTESGSTRVRRADYRRSSLAKLRSMERAMEMTLSRPERRRSK